MSNHDATPRIAGRIPELAEEEQAGIIANVESLGERLTEAGIDTTNRGGAKDGTPRNYYIIHDNPHQPYSTSHYELKLPEDGGTWPLVIKRGWSHSDGIDTFYSKKWSMSVDIDANHRLFVTRNDFKDYDFVGSGGNIAKTPDEAGEPSESRVNDPNDVEFVEDFMNTLPAKLADEKRINDEVTARIKVEREERERIAASKEGILKRTMGRLGLRR